VNLSKDGAVRIVLTSDLLFDSGRAELKPQYMRPLHKIAGILVGTPYILNIIGHTDNIAISNQQFSSNWELSTARACVTARYLIEKMGISPSRIYAAGHAEYDPIQSNRTREGRAANRRVEIVITREKPYLNSDRQFNERWEEK
jgi:chemotaxis protein MotB